jgi:hypothetical protein
VSRSVDNYLRSGALDKEVIFPGYEAVEQLFDLDQYADAERPETIEIPVAARNGSFDEVEKTMPGVVIREECKRCLRCDLEWLEMKNIPFEAQPDRPANGSGR